MGVYIKGMEMPRNCAECFFHKVFPATGVGINQLYCALCGINIVKLSDAQPDCPLVPVPPHGRLRKRIVYRGEVYNALESARVNALDGILSDPYKEGFHDGIKRAIQILANEVDDVPTIIPAEEGE